MQNEYGNSNSFFGKKNSEGSKRQI
ncbi:MAG TPA: hypothetical protein DCR40_20350 [Prolixibacteraceae bacterium]|nr:hypothetical protein [Prolixibacteraceae bacterium]